MKKTSERNVEQVVRSLLKQHGIESPPIPIDRLTSKLDLEVRSQRLRGRALLGFYLQKSHATAKPLLFINSSHHPNIQRSTLAHELGHFFLARKEVYVDRLGEVKSRGVSVEAADPEEIKAEEFAAELLMPRFMLVEDLKRKKIELADDKSFLRLAARYQVSLAAMIFRLQQLRLLRSHFLTEER